MTAIFTKNDLINKFFENLNVPNLKFERVVTQLSNCLY